MSDLISRQAAIDAAVQSIWDWDGMFMQEANCRIRDAINGLPTEEPVKEIPGLNPIAANIILTLPSAGACEGGKDITVCPADYIVEHSKTDDIVSMTNDGNYRCEIKERHVPLVKVAKRKEGEWIDGITIYDEQGRPHTVKRCNQCGEAVIKISPKFCPGCGAYMRHKTNKEGAREV